MPTVEISTPSDVEVVMTRSVDASVDIVWRAWTDPALIVRWMLGPDGWTMPVCEMPQQAGERWRYVWQKGDGGSRMEMTGLVVEWDPPHRLVTTERWGPEWPETINTVVLSALGKHTLVTHTMRFPSKAARDEAMKTGMADGLEQSFQRLNDLMQSREFAGADRTE